VNGLSAEGDIVEAKLTRSASMIANAIEPKMSDQEKKEKKQKLVIS